MSLESLAISQQRNGKGGCRIAGAEGWPRFAMSRHLDQISAEQIRQIEVPTGTPLIYELDDELRPTGRPDENGFRGRFLPIDEVDPVPTYHPPSALSST